MCPLLGTVQRACLAHPLGIDASRLPRIHLASERRLCELLREPRTCHYSPPCLLPTLSVRLQLGQALQLTQFPQRALVSTDDGNARIVLQGIERRQPPTRASRRPVEERDRTE